MESARHLSHICCRCLECRFWASAFFQTKNPRSAGREIHMQPEFVGTLRQTTKINTFHYFTNRPNTSSAPKNVCTLSKIPEVYRLLSETWNFVVWKLKKHTGTKLILHCHNVLKKAPNGVWTTIRLFEKVVPFQEKGSMLENCTETGKKIGTWGCKKDNFWKPTIWMRD